MPLNLSSASQSPVWPVAALLLTLCLAFILARQRGHARREVKRATRSLELLNEFHRALLTELDLSRLLDRVTTAIAPGLGFKRASIFLLNKRSGTLHDGGSGGDDPKLTLVDSAARRPAHGREGLFAPLEGRREGNLIILPVLGPQPEGANPACWLDPERRCTVLPRSTLATRAEQCPGCANFGPLGVLEAELEPGQPAQVDRLPDYARAGALALANARLYEQIARESERAGRRNEQLQLIFDVGREVTASLSVSRVLERLARGLNERLGYERVSIALVDGPQLNGHMTLVNGEVRWTRGISRIAFDIASHPDPLAQVARTGEPLVILDAAKDPRLPSHVRATVRTVAYVPIIAPADARASGSRAVLGVVAVDHGQLEREVDPSDLEVLTALGTQVGAAIANAREFEALATREQEARALGAVQEALAHGVGDGEPAWLDTVCDAIAVFANADFAFLTRVSEDGRRALTATVGASQLGRAAQHGLGVRRGSTLSWTALAEGLVVIPNAARDGRAAEQAAIYGPATLLVLPLTVGGRPLGALTVGRLEPATPTHPGESAYEGSAFGREDVERILPVAQELALTLENSDLAQAVSSERARLADALENLADGVILLEGETGRANAAARNFLKLGERVERRELPAQLRAILEVGGATPGGVEDGTLLFGDARLRVSITRHGSLTIAVLQDLERFRAAEQAKAEVLSVVSHELRTPLTAIIGFTKLLLSGSAGPLSDGQREFLTTTLDEGERLHQTVLNLLDASRLEAGLFELNTKLSRPDFANVLERYRRQMEEKGVRLEASLAAAPRMEADATRLELVFANLLSNALRYTPAGGTVHVLGEHDAKLNAWNLTVSDSGAGMSEAQLAGLFRRFSRGQDSREALEGAGLSLYVSRAIVAAHGGRIWAESQLGKGTTMRVTLPVGEPVAA